jgi:hypothetical protein
MSKRFAVPSELESINDFQATHTVVTLRGAIEIKLDGPYGDAGIGYEKFETLVFMVGGIGITPIACILSHLLDMSSAKVRTLIHIQLFLVDFFFFFLFSSSLQYPPKKYKVKQVCLVWTVKTVHHLEWFTDLLKRMDAPNGHIEFKRYLFVTFSAKPDEREASQPQPHVSFAF